MNYYKFHIGDWVLHTSHLTLIEEAVYRRLIDFYYTTEKPIPQETELVIRRLRLGSHADIVEQMLKEFFTLENNAWQNRRANAEIKRYNDRVNTAQVNGKLGGRPKQKQLVKTKSVSKDNPDVTEPKPNGKLTTNHKPLTTNQEPLSSKSAVAPQNKVKADAKKGTRLSESWKPSEDLAKAIADKEGFTAEQVAHEFYQFRNHWLGESGQKACKRSWDAAFRKWCGASYCDSRNGISGTAKRGGGSQGAVQLADAAEKAAKKRQDMGPDAFDAFAR